MNSWAIYWSIISPLLKFSLEAGLKFIRLLYLGPRRPTPRPLTPLCIAAPRCHVLEVLGGYLVEGSRFSVEAFWFRVWAQISRI